MVLSTRYGRNRKFVNTGGLCGEVDDTKVKVVRRRRLKVAMGSVWRWFKLVVACGRGWITGRRSSAIYGSLDGGGRDWVVGTAPNYAKVVV